ncbi:MAG: hypothetical protein WAK28_11230, partial [Trebonia sp.]
MQNKEPITLNQPTSSEQQYRALRALHKLSLIAHDTSDTSDRDSLPAVRMHALAQRATREAVGNEELQQVYVAAADALLEAWPDIESDSELSTLLRQNTSTLAELAAENLWKSRIHQVLLRSGRSLEDSGLVCAALDYWRQILDTSTRILGSRHPDTLTIRQELAYCKGQNGDAFGATAALEALLKDVIDVFGHKHRETFIVRRRLAWWIGETRQPLLAVTALNDLVQNMEDTLGPNDVETLIARYNLGRWRGQAGGAHAAID